MRKELASIINAKDFLKRKKNLISKYGIRRNKRGRNPFSLKALHVIVLIKRRRRKYIKKIKSWIASCLNVTFLDLHNHFRRFFNVTFHSFRIIFYVLSYMTEIKRG